MMTMTEKRRSLVYYIEREQGDQREGQNVFRCRYSLPATTQNEIFCLDVDLLDVGVELDEGWVAEAVGAVEATRVVPVVEGVGAGAVAQYILGETHPMGVLRRAPG